MGQSSISTVIVSPVFFVVVAVAVVASMLNNNIFLLKNCCSCVALQAVTEMSFFLTFLYDR
jgi:hypothetical protein